MSLLISLVMFEHADTTLYYFMLTNNRSIGNRRRQNEMKYQSLITRKMTFFYYR